MSTIEKEENLKKIRKLRKVLRQIEHLQILNRDLNDEEKRKVSNKVTYREELLYLRKEVEEMEKNESIVEEKIATVVSKPKEANEKQDTFMDNITEKLTNLTLHDSITEKSPKTSPEVTLVDSPKKEDIVSPKVELKSSDDKATKKIAKKAIKKQDIRYETFDFKNAHDDLITCIDICAENKLIATGSRDSSIKIWDFETKKEVKSFRGHTGPISCIKFLPRSSYKKALERALQNSQDDEDYGANSADELNDLNESFSNESNLPLVISTSFDCSFMIWDLNKEGGCLKQFYLYNKVNYVDLFDTMFVFALDGGKIEYWSDMRKAINLKIFDDSENATAARFYGNKIYALAHTGQLKVFSITEDNELSEEMKEHIKGISVGKRKEIFKDFILSNGRILFLNGQSYIISQIENKEELRFIPTNSDIYGMSTCFYKSEDLLYVSAYNIDTTQSSINVFSIDDEIKYLYSYMDKDESQDKCISTLYVGETSKESEERIMVTGIYDSFKLWRISNNLRNGTSVKQLHMYKIESDMHEESEDELHESFEEVSNKKSSQENEISDTDETESNTKSKKFCNIQ